MTTKSSLRSLPPRLLRENRKSFFANCWLDENFDTPNDYGGTDLDFSDNVDVAELRIFLDYWLVGFSF